MRKYLPLVFFLICLIMSTRSLSAQEKRITGKVLGEDNLALSGVTVLVKGTKIVTTSDQNGMFAINADPKQTLVFTSLNYLKKEVSIGSKTEIIIQLTSSQDQLDEVVVVAMDLKRNSRELGYSTQNVSGKDIQSTQRDNFVNSLQGRVAGVTVTPTTGAAGASSGIILRGFNTLSGTNQPLFIVDGIILDNSTLNTNSQGGSGIGLASDLPNRNNDYTNRIADINPNDIDNVTILKGPEATALYGSQASNGAIVITTKKSKSTTGKLSVTYDNNFRAQETTRFAQVNNDYGPGASNGIPTPPPLAGQFQSYGPVWPSTTKLYNNINNFYRTGLSQTHNIGMEFGKKDMSFRVSGQYLDNQGVIPNNMLEKYNFKISNNTKIGKYISIAPSFTFTSSNNVKPLKGSASTGGFLLSLYQWPANNDITNFETSNGSKTTLFNTNVNSDFDNPLWSAYNNYSGDKTLRYVTTLGIDITPFSWLSIAGRFGYDTYKTDGYLLLHPQSYAITASTRGSLDNYNRTYKGYNHTITATAKKNFGKFSTRLMAGTMWIDNETQQFSVKGTQLIDSLGTGTGLMYKNGQIITKINPLDSNTSLVGSRVRLLRNYFGLPNLSIFRELAYFGEVSLGYNNVAFLTYSHRFEIASPLPMQNRNYNFPGASLSLIISDIFPIIKKGNIVDYFKLRGSAANTARLNDPYSNQAVFVNNQNSSAIPGFTYGFTNANAELRPERQQTFEVGAEIRMLKNAITIEAAYYNTLATDQISQGYRASYATGFILNTTNASSLRNEGIELTVGLSPIRTKDFTWNMNFNYNQMWSEVLTLPASIGLLNDYYNSDTYISNVRGGLIRNQPTGTLTGSTYTRNTAGNILINPISGIPVVTTGNLLIADRTPDFTLGISNSFRYKDVSLSFLWDWKKGGDIYNGTDQALTALGKSARTSDRATPIVVNGVLNDGLQNSATPTQNSIVIKPYFLSSYYTSLPDEEFIQKDVNWLRLRDLSINYTLPKRLINKVNNIKSVSIFLTGNDLVLITNYRGADPAVNSNNPSTGGVGGYGIDLGSAPTPMSYSFGFRANF